MKKFWEMTMLTLFYSTVAGFGIAMGAGGAFGWIKFLSKYWSQA